MTIEKDQLLSDVGTLQEQISETVGGKLWKGLGWTDPAAGLRASGGNLAPPVTSQQDEIATLEREVERMQVRGHIIGHARINM